MMVDTNQEVSKKSVLFLCTGNSCRSQIAEAIINSKLGNKWQAFSAGTNPAGYVHPLAIQALEEIGINHRGDSKEVSQYRDEGFDLVVTVCDAAAQDCPVWLGSNPQVHLAFEDPAAFVGDEDAKLEKFRQVRDEIGTKIPGLLARYE